jgi:tetratricopeptide (TPR) repeat protein
LVRPDDQNGPQLYYYRIRDHLRRMGLGRQGLERLWREDRRLSLEAIPRNIAAVIAGADRDYLMRLWHSVLAAVPDREVQAGERALDTYEGIAAVRRGYAGEPRGDEVLQRLIKLLPDGAKPLDHGDEKALDALNAVIEKWKDARAGTAAGDRPEVVVTELDSALVGEPLGPGVDIVIAVELNPHDDPLIADLDGLMMTHRPNVDSQPANLDEIRVRGNALLGLAVSAYAKAIAKQPDNEDAWRGISRVLQVRARLAQAEQRHEQAAELWQGAMNILSQLIALNEYAALAYYNRACCRALVAGSRDAEARVPVMADLIRALQIRPDLKGLASRDPDLSELYEWAEFQELIGRGG